MTAKIPEEPQTAYERGVRDGLTEARALLFPPLLAALRCIPDGEIRSGCVVNDGAKVRERVRQAYLTLQDRGEAAVSRVPLDGEAAPVVPGVPTPPLGEFGVPAGPPAGRLVTASDLTPVAEADGLEAILDAALTIWGPDRMELPHIAVCASVVAGDLARLARHAVEVGPVNGDDIAKELGNLIVSAVRWAHDLDLDPESCVASALVAQAAYVERREGGPDA